VTTGFEEPDELGCALMGVTVGDRSPRSPSVTVDHRRQAAVLYGLAAMSTEPPDRLTEHLRSWLGAWPPFGNGITIVGSTKRTHPGWDGRIHDLIGVATPASAVISVPPHAVAPLANVVRGHSLADDLAALRGTRALAEAMGRDGRLSLGFFRWMHDLPDTPDTGEWVPTDDQRVPEWLKPFNGDVLIAWDDDGNYGAGVGRKQHDEFGHEISVGTEPALRGRGIARRLVTTAARRIAADGAIATYLHAPDNHASAKVAESAGFPDEGWKVIGYWGAEDSP
jgi:GNAT superfamily N-acetyltransferase